MSRFPPRAILAALNEAASSRGLSRVRFLREAGLDPSNFNPGRMESRKGQGVSLELVAQIEQAHALPTAWLLLRAEELAMEAQAA